MGKLIVCIGETAKNPYIFPETKTAVYTIEELCYYIYHNAESVTEELFSHKLTEFIRTELKMTERAAYLDSLIARHAGIKDMVVAILCSADYYDKAEINHLLDKIDQLLRLSPVQRKKHQADYCMRHGQWKEAMTEYNKILNGREFTELTSKEYGDILHNIGVLYAKTGAFVTASEKFREAYERNSNPESLKQYLYALKLSNQEALFDREMKLYVGSRELLMEIEEDLYQTADECEYTQLYTRTKKLSERKEQGQMQEYYEDLSKILQQLKSEYRQKSL